MQIAETVDRQAADEGSIVMIALDLDGTIMERGSAIRPELVDRLIHLSQNGIRCVTATGRPLPFQLDLLDRHGILSPPSVFAALIADEREIHLRDESGEYRSHAPWNDALREAWDALHPMAMGLMREAWAECDRRGWSCHLHLTEEEAYLRGLPTLYIDDTDQARIMCDWVLEKIRERGYPLLANRNVHIVQIYDRNAGKGPVLAEVSRLMGLVPHQVLAVGDSTNDLSMFGDEFQFRIATVENADVAVKDIVRRRGGYVASERSGQGVIEILDNVLPMYAGTVPGGEG